MDSKYSSKDTGFEEATSIPGTVTCPKCSLSWIHPELVSLMREMESARSTAQSKQYFGTSAKESSETSTPSVKDGDEEKDKKLRALSSEVANLRHENARLREEVCELEPYKAANKRCGAIVKEMMATVDSATIDSLLKKLIFTS